MAYSRFWDSDIYIYPHVDGHIECSTCILEQEDNPHNLFPKSIQITNDSQLLDHISKHRSKGHEIPDDLEQEILSDPDRYGKMIGYSTGKWSDDDDMHPTITPVFGPNR